MFTWETEVVDRHRVMVGRRINAESETLFPQHFKHPSPLTFPLVEPFETSHSNPLDRLLHLLQTYYNTQH